MALARHAAGTREIRTAQKILFGKPAKKTPLGRHGRNV
jgi:hypothetical protein